MLAAAAAGAAFASCLPFPSADVVTRLRVLAVRADPPEIGAGGEAALEPLVADPDGGGRDVEAFFFACDPSRSDRELTACENFAQLRELEAFDDPVELEKLPGIRRLATARYQAPAAPDGGRAPPTPLPVPSNYAVVMVLVRAGGEHDLAQKRVPVTADFDPHPNHNPELAGIFAGDAPVPADAPLDASGQRSVKLRAEATEASVETLGLTDGGLAVGDEELQFQWYTTAGSLAAAGEADGGLGGLDGGPGPDAPNRRSEVTLAFPAGTPDDPLPAGDTITVWAIVRDGRGGTGWLVREVKFR